MYVPLIIGGTALVAGAVLLFRKKPITPDIPPQAQIPTPPTPVVEPSPAPPRPTVEPDESPPETILARPVGVSPQAQQASAALLSKAVEVVRPIEVEPITGISESVTEDD